MNSVLLTLVSIHVIDTGRVIDRGRLPFGQKYGNFGFKSNGKVIFRKFRPEIPFGNCGVPSEVVLFFVRNGTTETFLPFR